MKAADDLTRQPGHTDYEPGVRVLESYSLAPGEFITGQDETAPEEKEPALRTRSNPAGARVQADVRDAHRLLTVTTLLTCALVIYFAMWISFFHSRRPVLVIREGGAPPQAIGQGQGTTLRWTVTGSDSVTIDKGEGPDTFRVESSGPGGRATAETQAGGTKSVSLDPPRIKSFTVSPASVSDGESAHITWTAQDADQITVKAAPSGGGEVRTAAQSGVIEVHPWRSTAYTLTAEKGGVRTSRTVHLRVRPRRPPIFERPRPQ